MKKLIALGVAVILLATVLFPVSVGAVYAGSLYFSDGMTERGVERWSAKTADYAYEAGLMFGIADGVFGFDLNVRTSEVICVIYRAARLPSVDGDSREAWYYTPMKWAEDNEIVEQGASPDGYLTRSEVIVILYKAAKVLGYGYESDNCDYDIEDYFDISTLSDEEYKAWAFLLDDGIVRGFPDKKLRPDEKLSREQLAKLSLSFLNYHLSHSEKGDKEKWNSVSEPTFTPISDDTPNIYIGTEQNDDFIVKNAEDEELYVQIRVEDQLTGKNKTYGDMSVYDSYYMLGPDLFYAYVYVPVSDRITIIPRYEHSFELYTHNNEIVNGGSVTIIGSGIEKLEIDYTAKTVYVFGQGAYIDTFRYEYGFTLEYIR